MLEELVFCCPYRMSIMSGPSAKKRRSIEDVRIFQKYWTEKFGVIGEDNKALCIFCFETVVCRTSSVKRYFENVHNNISNTTEEKKRELIRSALSKTKKQADKFINFISGRSSSILVAANFEVSKVIVQHRKPLSDGGYIKKAWLELASLLFDNFSEKEKIIQRIKHLSLSRKTIKERILKLENDSTKQLTQDLSSCKFFSICIDESIDITSSIRLTIFFRFCKGDELCEEIVGCSSKLPKRTTVAEICKAVVNEFCFLQIDIPKLVSVTTNGAPSMTGEKAGFVNLFTKKVGYEVIGFHYIIHEEGLCAKAGLKELQEAMQTVTKVVNCISAQALHKRQFQVLLNEVESVYKGLKMYNNVRWLSRGLVLKRFVECFNEIKIFLNDYHIFYQELSDYKWVSKLMFFADSCKHLNELKFKLQASGKALGVTFGYIKAFEKKLEVFKKDIGDDRFSNLKRHVNDL